MKGMIIRIGQIVAILLVLASSFGLDGCNNSPAKITLPSSQSSYPQTIPPNEPSVPIVAELSFPNGAPRLNQAAGLHIKVNTFTSFDNVTVEINLPDGIELLSNDSLIWFGNMSEGDVKEQEIDIKPIKVGNYTIKYLLSFVPKPGPIHTVIAPHEMYLAVSQDSAVWGIYPLWLPPWHPEEGPLPPVPPASPTEASSVPMNIQLSAPYAPALNEAVDITCTASSIIDIQNVTVTITSSRRLTSDDSYNMARPYVTSDNVTQTLNLKANQPVSFSTGTVFKEPGLWEIKAVANYSIDEQPTDKHTDEQQTEKHQLHGEFDAIYLTISSDKGEIGWPRTGPLKVLQVKKGDIDGIPSTSEYEPPVEKLPSPPAILPDGTLTHVEQHHSITVTGNLSFYWQAGDYRDNPTQLHPAKVVLVQLCDANGNHKAYGYTDESGNFSISGVDPSGGTKARWWCYTKYAVGSNIYELRVVDSGDSLTELTNVYQTYYTTVFNWPDDGGQHSVGNWILQASQIGLGAWWIKDDLRRAYLYATPRPGSCTVKWAEDSVDGTHYHVGGQVHLVGADRKAPDVVIHEYGHNVMYNVYGGYWPPNSCPSPHFIWQKSNVNCAWREGWAEFFPLAVNGNSIYTHTEGPSYDENFETGTSITVPVWEDGDTVEGRMAGTLWDIFDSNSDGFDTYSDGFDEIWDTLSHQTDNTFAEFYDAWKLRSHNQQEFLACAYQNTIIYDTVTLEQVLDTSGLTWTTGGNGN